MRVRQAALNAPNPIPVPALYIAGDRDLVVAFRNMDKGGEARDERYPGALGNE